MTRKENRAKGRLRENFTGLKMKEKHISVSKWNGRVAAAGVVTCAQAVSCTFIEFGR